MQVLPTLSITVPTHKEVSMKIFYIPDGHRRYAAREGISLAKAYSVGYRVLIDEVIYPLATKIGATNIGVFLLSSLNMQRRESTDLEELLKSLDELIPALQRETEGLCRTRIFGRQVFHQIDTTSSSLPTLDLFVGSGIEDPSPIGEVDLFLRSGGGLRLSGAPRALIGSYTELQMLQPLHPDLKRVDTLDAVQRYRDRYMAEGAFRRYSFTVGNIDAATEATHVHGNREN